MKQSRRKFMAAAVTVVASQTLPAMDAAKKQIIHHVFFWLKNAGSQQDKEKLIEGLNTLRAIKTVKKLQIGVPAATEKREVVDNSYDVCELMYFDTLAAQEAYQQHAIHVDFVKNYSYLWQKVVVYDMQEV
jgi:aminoglycoside phosphotransferase (APT) family kinase protein